MTKEELKKEAENWLRKYLLCCNCEKKCNCIDSNSYCEEQVLKAYVDSAEPREKRIAELEHQLTHRNCLDCSNHSSKLRMRTLELEKENAELRKSVNNWLKYEKETQYHKSIIKDLKKENAELKEKLEVVIALKDEEIGCIETDFNTFKSKAKELLKRWLQTSKASGCDNINIVTDTEQFISEVEK